MVRVAWKEMMYAYEYRWVEIPDSDIEQLLKDNPYYDKDDVEKWIVRNRWNYAVQYGDTDFVDDGESVDIEVDEDGELDGIIDSLKENHEDEEDEEAENTLIGTLGYDED